MRQTMTNTHLLQQINTHEKNMGSELIVAPKTVMNNTLSLFQLWLGRHRQRGQLARLTDIQLLDIGVSRELAQIEASKPFWSA